MFNNVTMSGRMIIEDLRNYVLEALGIAFSVHPWPEAARLPTYLQDNYRYHVGKILKQEFLLMVDDRKNEPSPATIGKQIQQLGVNRPVVYVCQQMTAYNRKRLISGGISFIVPGNQLYLPNLGMDLREYYRQKPREVKQFSPATQALLLKWIYNKTTLVPEVATATKMASLLGYSKMTMSRAFQEIDQVLASLLNDYNSGDLWKNNISSLNLWKAAQPYFRNPVISRHRIIRTGFDTRQAMRAGLNALSSGSMLAPPRYEEFAVSQVTWKKLKTNKALKIVPTLDDGCIQVEVWSYPPEILHKDIVDPLSLYLSLKENTDERIEQALDEIMGKIEW